MCALHCPINHDSSINLHSDAHGPFYPASDYISDSLHWNCLIVYYHFVAYFNTFVHNCIRSKLPSVSLNMSQSCSFLSSLAGSSNHFYCPSLSLNIILSNWSLEGFEGDRATNIRADALTDWQSGDKPEIGSDCSSGSVIYQVLRKLRVWQLSRNLLAEDH